MAKIKAIRQVPDLFPECQPIVGKIYEAEITESRRWKDGRPRNTPFCIIEISGKRIVLRHGEYEVVEE